MAKNINRRNFIKSSIGGSLGGMMFSSSMFPMLNNTYASQEQGKTDSYSGTKKTEKIEADVVVIGGGMSGVCAALAAARNGASTVLVQDRPVLGGNSSSEIRVKIQGADGGKHKNARESGILEELRLENQVRNPQHSAAMWDLILWEKVYYQSNLKLLLNTTMMSCRKENNIIHSINCYQFKTETKFIIESTIFIDCTGDGTLGYFSGNPYRMGQEAKNEFNESLAPEKVSPHTMGSSLLFNSRDMGHPVPFIKPEWAYTFPTDTDLNRHHGTVESGFWWIEWGGTLDTIKDDDKIREELLKILFGVWDHIKNQGDHGADNWALDWFGFLPGRRESRRLMGAYVLREDDVRSGRVFDDEVAFGGWYIDHHYPKGFHQREGDYSYAVWLDSLYSIPLSSLYSSEIKNLFFGGRAVSATHIAISSTRVMGTCSVIGQGAGTAAAYCCKKRLIPENLSAENIKDIKQTILKQDGYLIGTSNNDPDDFAQKASITAGSAQNGFEAENIIDGITRTVGNNSHQWRSASLNTADAYIELDFKVTRHLSELHLTFDTNFSRLMTLSHQNSYNKKMIPGPQPETVKDYSLEAYDGSGWETVLEIKNNCQRKKIHSFNKLKTRKLRIKVSETNGVPEARIFEIRCYE